MSKTAKQKIPFPDKGGGNFICPKLPSVVASSSPKAWREQPCLLLFLNLSLCRTPQRGSSRSKLGLQTLWRQPVPRQIGQGVLYVKLKARRHRSAGHSLKKLLLLQRNSGGVPPSKLRCSLGAKGKEGKPQKKVKLDPVYTLIPVGWDGTLSPILWDASFEANGDGSTHPPCVRCRVATSITVRSGGICRWNRPEPLPFSVGAAAQNGAILLSSDLSRLQMSWLSASKQTARACFWGISQSARRSN